MADTTPQLSEAAELDARIDSLLKDVDQAKLGIEDALSDLPDDAAAAVADSQALAQAHFHTQSATLATDAPATPETLDDQLVADLLASTSNEIELAAPGPLELPPEIPGATTPAVAPSPAVEPELINHSGVADVAIAEQELHTRAQQLNPLSQQPILPTQTATAQHEELTPELVAVLNELESPSPEPAVPEVQDSDASQQASLDQPGTNASVLTADAINPPTNIQATLPADVMSLVEADLRALADEGTHTPSPHEALDAQQSVTPSHDPAFHEPAPYESGTSDTPNSDAEHPEAVVAAKIAESVAAQPHAPVGDFDFVAPEALEPVAQAVAAIRTPTSVRELDDHLASSAPGAVEAAIHAAAAKATASGGGGNDPHHPPTNDTPSHDEHTTNKPAETHAPPASSAHAQASSASTTHATIGTGEHTPEPQPDRLAPVRAILDKVLAAATAPIARVHNKLGEPWRQTIGYCALMTSFFAVTTWIYFFIKAPPKLEAMSGTKTLLKPGEHAPSDHGDAHAPDHAGDGHSAKPDAHASGDSHAKKDTNKDAHGSSSGGHGAPAKKDSHGDASASHGAKKSSKKDSHAKKDAHAKTDKKSKSKKGAEQASAGH